MGLLQLCGFGGTEHKDKFELKVLLQLIFSSDQMPLSALWDHKFRRLVNGENWSMANVTNIMLVLCYLAGTGTTYTNMDAERYMNRSQH